MPRIKKTYIFPRSHTTNEKINITSLTITMGAVSRDKTLQKMGVEMVNSLYTKSQMQVMRRANALLAVLRAHQ